MGKTVMTAQIKGPTLAYPYGSHRRSVLLTRHPAIIETVTREFGAYNAKGPSAEEIAVQIMKAVESTKSPSKIW